VAVAPDLDVELPGERVDATDADAMQAAGDLVSGGVEFAAGMSLVSTTCTAGIILPLERSIIPPGCRGASTTVIELSRG